MFAWPPTLDYTTTDVTVSAQIRSTFAMAPVGNNYSAKASRTRLRVHIIEVTYAYLIFNSALTLKNEF
jgi:hypothetical protein